MKNIAKDIFFKQLSKLSEGSLSLHEANNTYHFGQAANNSTLHANITIHHPCVYQAILRGGSVAAAQMYFQKHWDSDDLTSLLRLFTRNQATLTSLEQGWVKLTQVFRWVAYQLRRNNVTGSRRNIAEHYDLSNEFFALFLDENMMYSSAIFQTNHQSLDDASRHKLDVICQKLRLKPTDRVLEIGSGWGGFALHAAEHYGCQIVTTTISAQQYQLAAKRIAEKNLSHRISLLQQDYRQLDGLFDKLVSIEMIEAVGHQYYHEFFSKCSQRLKPDGELLIQAITIQDQAFERAKHEIDFIKRYIFPGSCIPSVTALTNAMTRSSDLRLFNLEDIGLHYALTLKHWHERFLAHIAEIKALGFDETFIRLWQFYFCYCEAGFAEGYLGDMHLHAVKPRAINLDNQFI